MFIDVDAAREAAGWLGGLDALGPRIPEMPQAELLEAVSLIGQSLGPTLALACGLVTRVPRFGDWTYPASPLTTAVVSRFSAERFVSEIDQAFGGPHVHRATVPKENEFLLRLGSQGAGQWQAQLATFEVSTEATRELKRYLSLAFSAIGRVIHGTPR